MRRNRLIGSLTCGLAAVAIAAPAGAQFSDSYNFLKAVRDADGTKVMAALDKPGNSMLTTSDPSSGETPLLIVTKRRDATYLSFFLGRGADPNQRDRNGVAPLMIAAQLGWTDGALTLIKAGGRVDIANDAGETPLIIATHQRDPAMVRVLLANGADMKRTDRLTGKSALDYAQEDPRAAAVLKILKETPAHAVNGPQVAGPHQ